MGPIKMQRMLHATIFRVGIQCPQTETDMDFCAEETMNQVLFLNIKTGCIYSVLFSKSLLFQIPKLQRQAVGFYFYLFF